VRLAVMAGNPLFHKTRCVLVDIRTQGTLVQAANNRGTKRGEKYSSAHVFLLPIGCLEKTGNYAERAPANLPKNSVHGSHIRHSSSFGIVTSMPGPAYSTVVEVGSFPRARRSAQTIYRKKCE